MSVPREFISPVDRLNPVGPYSLTRLESWKILPRLDSIGAHVDPQRGPTVFVCGDVYSGDQKFWRQTWPVTSVFGRMARISSKVWTFLGEPEATGCTADELIDELIMKLKELHL